MEGNKTLDWIKGFSIMCTNIYENLSNVYEEFCVNRIKMIIIIENKLYYDQ